MDNQRNLLLAVVLSGLLILGWDIGMRYFYPEASLTASMDKPAATASATAPATAPAAAGVDGAEIGEGAAIRRDLASAIASAGRVTIDTPRLAGSINSVGLRVDDIVLKDHRESVAKKSGPVRLFAPEGTPDQYFAEFGFVAAGKRLPSTLVWQADGTKLTPETPVTFSHTDASGITYAVRFAIDDDYMITASRTVTNGSATAAIIQPFALINRTSANATADEFLVHSGPLGVFGGTLWDENNYEDLAEAGRDTPSGAASWLGFT
ncbi:MAG TPA: membrane protein insertase YidC, partial [Erythrobacter sp.]|nr:membrane protein insertase YidC [Erythrobacter sp.]